MELILKEEAIEFVQIYAIKSVWHPDPYYRRSEVYCQGQVGYKF